MQPTAQAVGKAVPFTQAPAGAKIPSDLPVGFLA
jgi:hypothetical protein